MFGPSGHSEESIVNSGSAVVSAGHPLVSVADPAGSAVAVVALAVS